MLFVELELSLIVTKVKERKIEKEFFSKRKDC